MGSARTSYEEGVAKKRPPTLSERGGAATAERTRAGLRAARQECPEQVTVLVPAGESLPVGSPVSLIRDGRSPSRVALLHGNRLIALAPESVSEAVRECVSREVRYVGTIERYRPDPTGLAALLRKE
jgi:hypothetical protein